MSFFKKIEKEVKRMKQYSENAGSQQIKQIARQALGGNITDSIHNEIINFTYAFYLDDLGLQMHPQLRDLEVGAIYDESHELKEDINDGVRQYKVVATSILRINNNSFKMSVIEKLVIVQFVPPTQKIINDVTVYANLLSNIGMKQTNKKQTIQKRHLTQHEQNLIRMRVYPAGQQSAQAKTNQNVRK